MSRERLIASLREIEGLVKDCLREAGELSPPKTSGTLSSRAVPPDRSSTRISDFGVPIRFFMKQYAKGMNGQQKFTLVAAYICRGKLNAEVKLEAIRDAWNTMKGLLGKFNTGYATWAKDNGWVNSVKPKVYVILPGWTRILKQNA